MQTIVYILDKELTTNSKIYIGISPTNKIELHVYSYIKANK